jgi:ElaB/YqjD/DUF883 family membrane-anchored ribosome-binding protein
MLADSLVKLEEVVISNTEWASERLQSQAQNAHEQVKVAVENAHVKVQDQVQDTRKTLTSAYGTIDEKLKSWFKGVEDKYPESVDKVKFYIHMSRDTLIQTHETGYAETARTYANNMIHDKVYQPCVSYSQAVCTRANPTVLRLLAFARPYVVQAVDVTLPYVDKAVEMSKPMVDVALDLSLPYVDRVVEAAQPYVMNRTKQIYEHPLVQASIYQTHTAIELVKEYAHPSTRETSPVSVTEVLEVPSSSGAVSSSVASSLSTGLSTEQLKQKEWSEEVLLKSHIESSEPVFRTIDKENQANVPFIPIEVIADADVTNGNKPLKAVNHQHAKKEKLEREAM